MINSGFGSRMILSPRMTVNPKVAQDARDFGDFSRKDNRKLLVELFNEIAGVPSYSMRMLQDEFIQDRMEPGEMVSFVKICRELVAVASSTGQIFGYPS